MKFKITISLIILYLFLFACTSITQLNKRNLSFLYNPVNNKLNGQFVVFHKSGNISTLYYKIMTSDILYERQNNKTYKGVVKLKYRLLNDFNSKEVSDSGSVVKVDSADIIKEFIIDSIDFKTTDARNYVMQIDMLDMSRKTEFQTFLLIDKSNPFCAQNFLIKTTDNHPSFKNYFTGNEKFRILLNSASSTKLYVKLYRKDFPVAMPPFSEHSEGKIVLKPDSAFTVDITNKTTKELSFKKTGIYYIQSEADAKGGLVVFRFYDDFPEITNASNMLYPLMYITTKNEFDKILLSKDKKAAVDNYWLELAGNTSRARDMIFKYYTRVKDANILFTSYEEGWKTDRGIIYIVYGSPNIVYKNTESETWVYGSTQSSRSIVFNFNRLSNPFTDNDFSLNRSSNYKNSWYNAVENWRR